MEFQGARVALYGRFLTHSGGHAVSELSKLGGIAERDLTRRTDLLVVGLGALCLVPSGHLLQKLRRAENLKVPVIGETRFWALTRGIEDPAPTFPIDQLSPPVPDGLLQLLNAFDLISFDRTNCRFSDVSILRDGAQLVENGHEYSSVIRLSLKAKQVSPKGRHRMVPADNSARLIWDDGETELDGQGLLGLPDQPTLDEVFEQALLAEAAGDLKVAVRLYELCAQMDRKDAFAPFNLANVLRQLDRNSEAHDRLSQAIARDPKFVDAHYNRALLEEEFSRPEAAIADFRTALKLDPDFEDAMFNLAQVLASRGQAAEASAWFESFIKICDDPDQIKTAKRARQAAINASPQPLSD